jgi:phenylacetate-coenzyme A ligase PaaK-like adenylate-forming protein
MNRVDVEAAVFQPENMEHLTGEYEAFIYDGEDDDEALLRISVECFDPATCDRRSVEETIVTRFLKYKPGLRDAYEDGNLKIPVNFAPQGGLELHRLKGRPKRLVDRRSPA